MKRLQGFIVGVLIAFLLMLNINVYADSINAFFNVVNIKVDGKQVANIGDNFSLDNGEKVPFSISYKNTTYLPMRKLSELLNLEVNWNGENKTASILSSNEMSSTDKVDLLDSMILLKTSTRLSEIAQEIQVSGMYNNTKGIFQSLVDVSSIYETYYDSFKTSKKSFENEKKHYKDIANRVILYSQDETNIEAAKEILIMLSNIENIITLQEDLFVVYKDSKNIELAELLYDVRVTNAEISNTLLTEALK